MVVIVAYDISICNFSPIEAHQFLDNNIHQVYGTTMTMISIRKEIFLLAMKETLTSFMRS